MSGSFTGTAKGMGEVSVTLTLTDNVITDCTAKGDEETPGIGSVVIEQFPGEVVEGNTINLDSISGATITSNAFVEAAKRNFTTLQAAWDRSDVATLRSMMTDSMLDEIRAQLAERETHRGDHPNQTDVVMLEAQLLGIEDLGEAYMASVEFSGMIREEPSAGPSPFREVWNMTKPKHGSSGWLVAGVQALQ